MNSKAKLINKKGEKGYSLLEMMFVLFIISTILLITLPSFQNSLKVKNIDYFFDLLKKDLYESQMIAMTEGVAIRYSFSPTNNNYIIRQGVTVIKTRTFPEGLSVEKGTLEYNNLRFLPSGNVSHSGTLLFRYEGEVYVLVIQLVRGRFYIEKL